MANGNSNGDDYPNIVELNVGGVFYTTSLSTLIKEKESLLGQIFSGQCKAAPTILKDNKGKYFLDRDGVLFRYVLDYLRNQKLVLPENFHEKERLKQEADFFKLPTMSKCIGAVPQSRENGSILVGYRGTFAFGRDGLADVKFRKLGRLLVCGRISLCREVFGDSLNESRDPDRGSIDRYTSRFFLKHTFLEQAFDNLIEAGFQLSGSCGSGTNSAGEVKPGMDEECKWNHYNEFIFVRF
ncbi:hypothetical protein CAPTEDRAFT_134287 [Capitella teleta]|uniref:Uncharacterized protein n=1 Tax=Capitella teleta TaxID=283909 RepID=R7VBA0_CAPTE|nr:hypothetical protein CAPTEDRAFT_134287 [Capitella teleta]|eukprot:ELU12980.1 hypothetical protein CAPTEDRAFT_134287 [Capitella teleta]